MSRWSAACGNAFAILGAVSMAIRERLRDESASPSEVDAAVREFIDEATAGDYDRLLGAAMAWVEVV